MKKVTWYGEGEKPKHPFAGGGGSGGGGIKGDKGEPGRDGAAATVTVGTVRSGDAASVTNSGTPTAAVLDFVLPRGERGERGADGAAGSNADDSVIQELRREIDRLKAAQSAESGYAEYQEGYISRNEIKAFNGGQWPGNGQAVPVSFPKPFSRRPDMFIATLDSNANAAFSPYIANLTEKGFTVGINYGGSLQGVWYRAGVKKSD